MRGVFCWSFVLTQNSAVTSRLPLSMAKAFVFLHIFEYHVHKFMRCNAISAPEEPDMRTVKIVYWKEPGGMWLGHAPF